MPRLQTLAIFGLAALLVACTWDASIGEQRQQAAAALDRWAAAVAASDDGDVQLDPPAWDAYDPPAGLVPDSVVVSADARHLLVEFTGSPDPGGEPCGADYFGEAVESELAVVLIIAQHQSLTLGACADIGGLRTATIALAAPLGDRAVLEVVTGMPLDVER